MKDVTSQQSATLVDNSELYFNYAAALIGRVSSRHTERAYYRWVDTYLVDLADLRPTEGRERVLRMQALPLERLLPTLSATQLRAWLGQLNRSGHGKQGIDQARASIVTLADLLAEAEWLDDAVAAGMSRVRPPKAEEGQRPGRWLSPRQLRQLMEAAPQIATSENMALRNELVISILCTMALRRDELASARWDDLSIQNDRMVLRVHGKGKKTAVIDVPQVIAGRIERWRTAVQNDNHDWQPASPLVRRLWKGGRIGTTALSADSIWTVVRDTARFAGLGKVAPHDLRRSVAGALQENGVPIDKISQLLRHSNVAVTEKYLSQLPQINEGALLMSDVLGWDEA